MIGSRSMGFLNYSGYSKIIIKNATKRINNQKCQLEKLQEAETLLKR